jgi:hypothetical protein
MPPPASLTHVQCVTMVVALDEPTVRHVADDRTAETLASDVDGVSSDERLAIEAIAPWTCGIPSAGRSATTSLTAT